jgi:hypothetical protein
MSSTTCEIPDEIVQSFKKFKLSNKANCAILMKINKAELKVELDTTLDDVSVKQIAQELPESAPRYIAYSYKHTHSDGRTSLPLVFIFYCPSDISPTLNMLYASTKTRLINSLQIMKTFDVQSADTLTDDWLKGKLKLFD